MLLTPRYREALSFACTLHENQTRKGSGVPYVSHLLWVSATILDHGGDEDQAVAGLLHDAVEDQGGLAVADDIRARFGDRVVRIVLECSDSHGDPKPPWRDRKEAYVAAISTKSRDALLVTAADKLHNARSILRDFDAIGDALWPRFTGGREGSLWHYRAVSDALAAAFPGRLSRELADVVSEIERRST
jgi:GTP pyrophosphokinase